MTDRRLFDAAMIKEAAARLGGVPWEVASDSPGGGKPRVLRGNQPVSHHDYRTILPGELVFDVGDDGDWARCVRNTEALWDTLDWLNVKFMPAPSGGRGTHTGVLGPPPHEEWCCPDWRPAFANYVIHHTMRRNPGLQFECDWRLIAPGVNARIVREYGSGKGGGKTKRVWDRRFRLPRDRDSAYSAPASPVGAPPINESLGSMTCRPPSSGPCPKSEACLSTWLGCLDCPEAR